MGKPNLAAGRFDITSVAGQRTLIMTSQTDDEFESANYLNKGVYRVTLKSDRDIRGADDVFYTGTSLGLHLDPSQGFGGIVECSPGFNESGQAEVIVKIFDSAGDPRDSAFYLFAAIKN